MFAKSASLRRSLAWRLLVALAIALVVTALGIALASRLIGSSVGRHQLDTAAGHFKARITGMESDWRLQAEAFRSQLLVSRVLEEPDVRLLRARLTAFSTALGGEGTFSHIVLTDAANHIVHSTRTRSAQDLELPAASAQPAWIFGQLDQTLYRSFSLPVTLASGRGHLFLFAPVDNALLGRNVYPDTAVCLLWKGQVVAESPALSAAGDPAPPTTSTRLMNWSDEPAGPQIRIERRIILPLGVWQVLGIAALALLAIGLLVWLSLGRWLARQSRRLTALEQGTADFVAAGGLTEAVLRKLDEAADSRRDEISKLASAARKAMQNTGRQERLLQQEQQRMRDMAELSSDWFWEQDADYRFTFMSESLLAINGTHASSIVGKLRWELPVSAVDDKMWAEHRALLDRREPFRDFEYRFLNDNSEVRWSSVSGKPLFDTDSHFTGYRGTGRDITERMHGAAQLRESESRSRALLELSSDWYWEMDARHRLTRREGAVLSRFGVRAEQDLGKTHWELGYINIDDNQWSAHRALLERHEEFREMLVGRPGADGNLIWARLSGRPRYDDHGAFIGYHGVGRGVTAQVNAERALRDNEAELRLITDSAPASIGYFDRDLVLRFANRTWETVFNRKAADTVGKNFRDFASPATLQKVDAQFEKALGGTTVSYRRINDAPGAMARVLDFSLVPHRDASGNVVGCYSIAIDVTAVTEAQEEVRSLQHLFTSTFQNTSDLMAIYRVESDRLIIEGFNQALWRFYEARYAGIVVSDWAGKPINQFLREIVGLTSAETDARLASFWKCVRTAEMVRYQTDLPTPTGTHRRDSLLVPIADTTGRVTHVFYRAADITELARKEEELQALNAGLERKVVARTADLSAANRELEAFAYAVSHDLRTPLRGIDGFSKLLVDELGPSLAPSGASHLQRIRLGIQRMGDLIDDLLRLSRVTRGPLKRSPVDLSALAAEVGAELARQAPGRDVDWRIMPGMSVSADPGLMRLLLDNLLGNAFKYSRHVVHAVIEIDASPAARGVEIRVRDNGAGFDMAYADKLFQPFQRLHGVKEFEGTGVGLATVFRIVARHGGTIHAHGETGKGAEFRITLPHEEPDT